MDANVLQADIVIDVGRSLNPAIDMGQIEGAFLQGPENYKIPAFKNIPVKLNVTLLTESANARAVYSSKVFLNSLDRLATPERILLACLDQLTEQFPPAAEGGYTAGFVYL